MEFLFPPKTARSHRYNEGEKIVALLSHEVCCQCFPFSPPPKQLLLILIKSSGFFLLSHFGTEFPVSRSSILESSSLSPSSQVQVIDTDNRSPLTVGRGAILESVESLAHFQSSSSSSSEPSCPPFLARSSRICSFLSVANTAAVIPSSETPASSAALV
jgi:hypothetical protein